MIAYNHTSLDNLLINEEASVALNNELISKEEADAIKNVYPVNLYTPNLFIRIGLFLLTVVIVLMGFGLFWLLTKIESEKGIGTLVLIVSLMLYTALEFLIREKKHYRSGIDDALLWLSIAFMSIAAALLFPYISFLARSVLIFILTFYILLRFGNILISGLVYLSFLAIVFYAVIRLGDVAKIIMPFLLMAISFFVYWLMKKNKHNSRVKYYKTSCTFVEILALVTLYAAGNYFVVREVSNSMFELGLKEGESIPGGWFFWITTILLPIAYIFRGIQKKDVVILRTGLVLVAAIVCTIRYYHHIAPLEVAITIGGIIMIIIAYAITKYLTTPRHGFTHAEPNDPALAGWLQVESLVVTQTFHQTTPVETVDQTKFGGGSGGGGGATGGF
ncbi:hypothetical protein FAM09_25000 [Niastella caeni]|uniref:DUF2157 domain-containing protein n=1 Tax=Niastella caeni TaxID=2569763 RepID=A0A4S8HKM9_9BACT|nr:hypothetical protein [Niastella caeni]THU33412.1 hypothetical protein FAM09_25000 [Niastella caeni]